MPIAVNPETGEVRYLDNSGEWKKARIAENPQTGKRLAWDGSAWQEIKMPGEGAGKPAASTDLLDNPLSNITDMAVQGITFGLADEIGAAGSATGKALRNLVQGKPAGWMDAYNEDVAANRKRMNRFQSENPFTATAAEIVGGMASPAAKALQGLATAGEGAGIAARTGKAALAGAAAGGLYGAGNAPGGPAERIEGAIEGAAIGGATGAVLSPVIEGLVAIGQKGLQRIFNRVAGLSDAERTVARALNDLGDGDIRRGLQKVREGLAEGGKGAAPVDVMGITGQKIARAAANVPGEGAEIADKFVQRRQMGRGYRFRRALDTLAQPEDAGVAIEKLTKQRQARTGPKYDAIATRTNLLPKKAYEKLRKIPYYRKLEREVINDPLYDLKGADPRSLEVVHTIKQRLGNEIENVHAKGRGNDEPLLMGVMENLLRRVDKAYPEYKDVRGLYAGYSRRIDAIKDGQKFHLRTPEELAAMFKDMSPLEQDAFRLGARNAIEKMVATDTQAAANKLADKKLGLWERIRVLFPDNKSFRAYKRQVENEIMKMRTEQFAGPRAGSHTEPLKQDIVEYLRTAPMVEKVPEAATDYARWNLPGLLIAGTKAVTDKLKEPNRRKAAELARMLFEMNKPKAVSRIQRLATPRQVPIDNERRKALARLLSTRLAGESAATAMR